MDTGFVLFIMLVVLAIGGIGFIPLFLLRAKAEGLGASISWAQAFQLLSRQSTDKEFLRAIALDQEHHLDIGITKLETHLLAGGDPFLVMQSVLLAKEMGMDFDFGQLSAIQLGGKDPVEAVNLTQEIANLEIIGYRVNHFQFDYHAQYRFGIGRSGIKEAEIDQKIKDRLKVFTQDWPSKDADITQNFLVKNILYSEYWEKVLGALLVQHFLDVKRI